MFRIGGSCKLRILCTHFLYHIYIMITRIKCMRRRRNWPDWLDYLIDWLFSVLRHISYISLIPCRQCLRKRERLYRFEVSLVTLMKKIQGQNKYISHNLSIYHMDNCDIWYIVFHISFIDQILRTLWSTWKHNDRSVRVRSVNPGGWFTRHR